MKHSMSCKTIAWLAAVCVLLTSLLTLVTVEVLAVETGETEESDISSLFEYTIQNGEVKLTRYLSNDTVELIIPDTIEGCPVTVISSSCFYSKKTLEKVVLPSTLKRIFGYAFYGCEMLTAIEFPEGLTRIEDNVFEACSRLRTITFPSTLEYIGAYTFKDCVSLRRLELPEGLTVIAMGAFKGCTSLEGVVIPSTLTHLYNVAFNECENMSWVMFYNTDLVVDELANYVAAFKGTNIQHVFYTGTEKEWVRFCNANTGVKYYVSDATIHYEVDPSIGEPVSEQIIRPVTCLEAGKAALVCNLCGDIIA